MNITAKTKLCIIIGDPVEHSLSPSMHNAAYTALGIDDKFIFVASRVTSENLGSVIKSLKVMNVRGITCTIPHKIEVMKCLDEIDETAKKIGAVNSIVNEDGKLKGYNTDWLGIVTPLEKHISLKGKKAAVIGAGGAAHAMVFGLIEKGAAVTVFNRTVSNAEELANHFNATFSDLSDLSVLKDFDVILNATDVGMGEHINETPVPKEFIQSHHIIFDAVYIPYETKLLKEAQEVGATVIHGTEMLLHQGMPQFELYTGMKASEEVMRKVLIEKSK